VKSADFAQETFWGGCHYSIVMIHNLSERGAIELWTKSLFIGHLFETRFQPVFETDSDDRPLSHSWAVHFPTRPSTFTSTPMFRRYFGLKPTCVQWVDFSSQITFLTKILTFISKIKTFWADKSLYVGTILKDSLSLTLMSKQ